MLSRIFHLLLVAGLVTGRLWAADDPFVGEWKLNSSKSKIFDVMKVESVPGNKYVFDFGAGSPTTVVPDGTDQPSRNGTTMAVTIEATDSWKLVFKKDGRVVTAANWKLSEDGSTLTDDLTGIASDGSSTNLKYVYKRTAGTSGFAGTWESASAAVEGFTLKIQPYEGDGLSFIFSSEGFTMNAKFDGKDHLAVGPNAPPGLASSARRLNGRTLEVTDKRNGKVGATRKFSLSSDGKTLTMISPGTGREPNTLVFDRQ
jgi:hypothetical protein